MARWSPIIFSLILQDASLDILECFELMYNIGQFVIGAQMLSDVVSEIQIFHHSPQKMSQTFYFSLSKNKGNGQNAL